jgi:uncharacterized protein YukE
MKKMFGFLGVAVAVFFFLKFSGTLGNSAIDYNDRIVASQNKIIVKILDLANSFEKSDPDEMDEKLQELQSQIDDSLATLSAMESYDGYTRLRDGAIELIKFYKSIAQEEYREIVETLSQPESDITQSDYNRLLEIQKDIEDSEADLDNELQAAQQEFAKMNDGCHGDVSRFKGFQFTLDTAAPRSNDGPRMSHAFPFRGGSAGNIGHNRRCDLTSLNQVSHFFFHTAAHFSDQ